MQHGAAGAALCAEHGRVPGADQQPPYPWRPDGIPARPVQSRQPLAVARGSTAKPRPAVYAIWHERTRFQCAGHRVMILPDLRESLEWLAGEWPADKNNMALARLE